MARHITVTIIFTALIVLVASDNISNKHMVKSSSDSGKFLVFMWTIARQNEEIIFNRSLTGNTWLLFAHFMHLLFDFFKWMILNMHYWYNTCIVMLTMFFNVLYFWLCKLLVTFIRWNKFQQNILYPSVLSRPNL